ncbi:hypothetical protein ACFV0L_35360 [Streptosporangium canum]|uniref:hypothetical protein n=1 Tax=Streptosporangium canum TaxID=324952 RepID=UPI0036738E59
MTTNRARAVVRELLSSGETGLSQMSGQVDKMAKELVATGKANREQLDELVRLEVNRLLGALDLARSEDVDRLRTRVGELEARVASAEEALGKVSAERSRTTAEGEISGRPARGAARAGKAVKDTGEGEGEGTKATSAAASDTVKASTVKASTGKVAHAPRARTTTKSAKSTSGGGA